MEKETQHWPRLYGKDQVTRQAIQRIYVAAVKDGMSDTDVAVGNKSDKDWMAEGAFRGLGVTPKKRVPVLTRT